MDYLIQNQLDFNDPFFDSNSIPIRDRFNAYRLVDLICSKFAMSIEENLGLLYPPIELLDLKSSSFDKELGLKNNTLSELATRMGEFAHQPKSKNTSTKKSRIKPTRNEQNLNKKNEKRPYEIEDFKNNIPTEFKKIIFEQKISSLKKNGKTWEEILMTLKQINPSNFGDTSL